MLVGSILGLVCHLTCLIVHDILLTCHSPAEVLPLQIREQGLAIGNMFYWLFQFMMVEITPIAIKNIYYKFYIILAVFNVCIAVIVWLFFPETAKLTLEELDFFFAKRYGNGGIDVEKEDMKREESVQVKSEGQEEGVL